MRDDPAAILEKKIYAIFTGRRCRKSVHGSTSSPRTDCAVLRADHLAVRSEPFDSPFALSLSKGERFAQDWHVEGRAANDGTASGGKGSKDLPRLCLNLLSEQTKAWPELRQGCEGLGQVRERTLSCTGFSVRLQHNPGRIKSSLAAVGEESSKQQPCFLCLERLPQGQKGILYRGEYLILCNPMPIFFPHFTVSHLDHRNQLIEEEIDSFLRLGADLGFGWAVLYNGSRCGASAPGHLHYQVVPSGQMPIEREILERKRPTLPTPVGASRLYRLKGLGREVVVLEGTDAIGVADVFRRFLSALRRTLLIVEEPMINIAGYRIQGKGKRGKWRLLIFPRQKHRPNAFFQEGEGRLVISPGVIDMGGVFVAPVERDFERLDTALVEGIYREVSLEEHAVETSLATMIPDRASLSIR